MSLSILTPHAELAATSTDVGSGDLAFDDAVRSAVARGSVLGEPSAVLVIAVGDVAAAQAAASAVRAADVVTELDDGSCGVVLFGISRLPAASVADRLERQLTAGHGRRGPRRVGMSFVAPWDHRDAATVLLAARADLRERAVAELLAS